MLLIRNDFDVLDGKLFEIKITFPPKEHGEKYKHWVKLGKELKTIIEKNKDKTIDEVSVIVSKENLVWHEASRDFIMDYLQEHWKA